MGKWLALLGLVGTGCSETCYQVQAPEWRHQSLECGTVEASPELGLPDHLGTCVSSETSAGFGPPLCGPNGECPFDLTWSQLAPPEQPTLYIRIFTQDLYQGETITLPHDGVVVEAAVLLDSTVTPFPLVEGVIRFPHYYDPSFSAVVDASFENAEGQTITISEATNVRGGYHFVEAPCIHT